MCNVYSDVYSDSNERVSALRIQVSEHCKELLDQLGAYEFDDRGQVEVKVRCRLFTLCLFSLRRARIKVGAIGGAALGPFKK